MSRTLAVLLAGTLVLGGCRKDIRTKEKVQEAILKRLETSAGLDMKSLDVNITSVSYNKNLAYATVAFHQKGDSSLNSGMLMTYTLEQRGDRWAILKVGDSNGHGIGGAPGADVPSSPGTLPPGHPPVNSADPQVKPMSYRPQPGAQASAKGSVPPLQ